MKELSIEEKAQAYDEVLKKARMFYKDEHVDNEVNSLLEVLFPELKESEYERIRKALIEFVQGIYMGCRTEEACKERDMFLAWLEKQCEQKSVESKTKVKDKWNEKNSPYYDDICEILINLLYSENTNINKDAIQKDLNWLTNLHNVLEKLKKVK